MSENKIVEITKLGLYGETYLDVYVVCGVHEPTFIVTETHFEYDHRDCASIVDVVLARTAAHCGYAWKEEYLPTAKKLIAEFVRSHRDQLWQCRPASVFGKFPISGDVVESTPEITLTPTLVAEIPEELKPRIAQSRALGHDGTTLDEQRIFDRWGRPLQQVQPCNRPGCGSVTGCMCLREG